MSGNDRGARTRFLKGKARREQYVELRSSGTSHEDALARIGVTHSAYRYWRANYKDFAALVDSLRFPGMAATENTHWTGGFSDFRRAFFDHQSPWFHELIIQALEQGQPGSVTLITIPPEHGKTTLLEDYCNMKLAFDPLTRITVGSEKQQHSRKVLRRVRARMDEDSQFKTYVHRFGPFRAPRKHPQRQSQPWAADWFDVFKKGKHDERDYSMVALGMGSAIAGTRTDLLLADDPQSRKSLNRTDELFDIFRQDWLSRPGAHGKTVVLMTRQGEDDFADRLLNSEILDHHIQIPVWDEEKGWLWPDYYDEHQYQTIRRNVGEEAWEHNYMQVARPRHTIVFTRDVIERGRDGLRTTLHSPENLIGGVIIGMDPGFGVTGLTAAVDTPNQFLILRALKRRNLSGTEAIIAELEDLVAAVHIPHRQPVTDLVIESKAFQRGLLTDARILAMQRAYGFRIHPHETSEQKYDPDFGIPQMVHSLLREEITWPWADESSRAELGELEADMYRWRPHRKGTELVQDVLMSCWFPWLLWRNRRRVARTVDTEQFRTRPAPRLAVVGRPR